MNTFVYVNCSDQSLKKKRIIIIIDKKNNKSLSCIFSSGGLARMVNKYFSFKGPRKNTKNLLL